MVGCFHIIIFLLREQNDFFLLNRSTSGSYRLESIPRMTGMFMAAWKRIATDQADQARLISIGIIVAIIIKMANGIVSLVTEEW